MCLQNDKTFRKAIPERHDFFQQIGFKSAKILSVAATPLDFKFFITYFLFDSGSGPKIAFYISHDDEQKLMQEAGLVPKR